MNKVHYCLEIGTLMEKQYLQQRLGIELIRESLLGYLGFMKEI